MSNYEDLKKNLSDHAPRCEVCNNLATRVILVSPGYQQWVISCGSFKAKFEISIDLTRDEAKEAAIRAGTTWRKNLSQYEGLAPLLGLRLRVRRRNGVDGRFRCDSHSGDVDTRDLVQARVVRMMETLEIEPPVERRSRYSRDPVI